MFAYHPLKNNAGILLIGDYDTLRRSHSVIHDVNDRSPLIHNPEGFFIGLAYDIRKAYERQREILEPPEHYEEAGVRYGVQILWPMLIMQVKMLRESLAFIDHPKGHQAVAYALEAVLEEAIEVLFGDQAKALNTLMEQVSVRSRYVEDNLYSRCALFSSWGKTERKQRMLNLIESLVPTYPAAYKIFQRQRDTPVLTPEDFEGWGGDNWPDPDW